MGSYFHIVNNGACNWKIGDDVNFGKEDNYFWRSFVERGEFIQLNGKSYDVHLIARHALDAYTGKFPPPNEMKSYHFDPIRTLQETLDSLGNSIKACRELALESVRREYYPHLPSRQKCVWLIPDEKEAVEFWWKVIQGEDKRIFRVEVDGRIHRAAQKLLIGGSFSIDHWNSQAHSYWQGAESGSIEDEILFEGKMRIVREGSN